jgi:hypothetical protein
MRVLLPRKTAKLPRQRESQMRYDQKRNGLEKHTQVYDDLEVGRRMPPLRSCKALTMRVLLMRQMDGVRRQTGRLSQPLH